MSSPQTAPHFADFFAASTGKPAPYGYQCRLACGDSAQLSQVETLTGGAECQSQLLSVPTGLGKTAAVVLAWMWNRVRLKRPEWPRRLVYCLPMRTLVEQTEREVKDWVCKSDLLWDNIRHTRRGKIGVHVLMGGEEAGEWDLYPEENAILIGTQDMLLSRALNRGYGMSRYRWPMHFGLLNNDCLWVLDETQLMGPGLWTSGQLDWMRQHRFGVMKPCFTWWMSATPSPAFLDTPDRRKDDATKLPMLEIGDDKDAFARLNAIRPLKFWKNADSKAVGKKKTAHPSGFCVDLAASIRAKHEAGTLSLVVCNTVKAAQELYRAVDSDNAILLTSRFRSGDRNDRAKRLLDFEELRKAAAVQTPDDDTVSASPGLICVSTQVVEAGLDVSARNLWMEVAPWPSSLQRLGRLNRDGRSNGKACAFAFEWPLDGKKIKGQFIGPYEEKDIKTSLGLLTKLASIYEANPKLGASEAMAKLRSSHEVEMLAALKPKDEEFPRAIDLHGLFSTEPDVFGGFTDVSPWVRGADKNADAVVFWREFEPKKGPGKTEDLIGPGFKDSEGCRVAIHRLREFLDKTRAHVWDDRSEQWQSLRSNDLHPGMVVLLPRTIGGYTEALGWTGQSADRLAEAQLPGRFHETFEEDGESESASWVLLSDHLAHAKFAATQIADDLALDSSCRKALITAAELHDIGKSHPIWQNALPHSTVTKEQLWAKAPHVLALHGKNARKFRQSTEQILTTSGVTVTFFAEKVKGTATRQFWQVSEKIRDTRSRYLLAKINTQAPGLEAWMARFLPRPEGWNKPCIRHEAASALASWFQYFRGNVEWPGLTLFLIACHHGKVRTMLYSRGEDGEDVCGVPKQPEILPWAGGLPMDFSCAEVGTGGEFSDDGLSFTPTAPSWSGLVADLLGSWEKHSTETHLPLVLRHAQEPWRLGVFKLAYLEALIRAIDAKVS